MSPILPLILLRFFGLSESDLEMCHNSLIPNSWLFTIHDDVSVLFDAVYHLHLNGAHLSFTLTD
jgi:hypothetical protein